ncbi:MAG: hypothetical protein LUQ13_02960 [Methanomicrobiales archaeon]|nr:hypothetical protein [Methanomicrobiales archaeon]
MKKQEKKKPINWTKVSIVGICVLFAFAMVATYLSPIVGSMRTIKPNESVLADITVRDSMGTPLVTTDSQVFANSPPQSFLLRNPMTLKAGGMSTDLTSLDAYNRNLGSVLFTFHQLELDEMNAAIIGMRSGETKNVKFDFTTPLELEFNVSAEYFDAIGGNFTIAEPGDWFTMGYGTNETDLSAYRPATIKEKTDSYLVISSKYTSVDITIKSIGNQ